MLISLVKIAAVFLVMLAGIRLRLGIGVSILLGSLCMGFLFELGILQIFVAGFSGLGNVKLLLLVIIIEMIMVLSELLEKTGQNQRILKSFSGMLPWPSLKLVFFPALIGMLPMPGGAIFSAPMLKTIADDFRMSEESKALINYWFRHIWELAWPLYPGIILAAYLIEIPLVKLISMTWPGLALTLFWGWMFYILPVNLSKSEKTNLYGNSHKDWAIIYHALPLIIAVGGTLFLEAIIWNFDLPLHPELGFILALSGAIICTGWQNRTKAGKILEYFYNRHVLFMVGSILAIFFFKGILEHGGIIQDLTRNMSGDTALVIAAVTLPFLVGLISGITLAFVGSSFPIILGLSGHLGFEAQIPYLVLALFAGYTGVLISPIHICFLLTCEYFQVNAARVWSRLVLPCLLFFACGLAYFFFLHYV